jgi:hypothetical protein|eukprot:COSAG06_NODE_735_length_12697_cov_9.204398_6_plen_73_part_00
MCACCCVSPQGRAKTTFASSRPKKEDKKDFDARMTRVLTKAAEFLRKEESLNASLEAAMAGGKKTKPKKPQK